MRGERNPWEVPEWHAIEREAALVRHLVGSGATALGRANYADNIGEYYTAFFGLSVGVERLAKLILVRTNGVYPQLGDVGRNASLTPRWAFGVNRRRESVCTRVSRPRYAFQRPL